MPGDLPRFRNEIESSRGQGRHVQRLTDGANAIRPASVLMDKQSAAGEIKQRKAAN
jgi:hypothetical protein